MNTDITAMIDRCGTCKQYAYRQQEKPLQLRETPLQPWARIGADLCMYARKSYLVLYDAYSNLPEVAELQDTSTKTVIDVMASMFSRHGLPLEFCTDGGPQFTAGEFTEFAAKYDFKHVVSSPRFPRSNGLAEKGVQVVKRLLKKYVCTFGPRLLVRVLTYRTTPLECGSAPVELLMRRKAHTLLPGFVSLPARPVLKHKQDMKQGRALSQLEGGETVRV